MKKCCCCGEEVVSGFIVCEECKNDMVGDDDSFRRGYQSALREECVEIADDAHIDGFGEGFSFCIEEVQEWAEKQGERISKAKLLKMLGGLEDA